MRQRLSSQKMLALPTLLVTSAFAFSTKVKADIVNPATGNLGGTGLLGSAQAQRGEVFVAYFLILWNAAITIGGILVLLYFVWGAVEWITAGGEAAKLQTARNKMLHAFIGLLLLVSSFTIVGFISSLLFGTNFNILHPIFISPL